MIAELRKGSKALERAFQDLMVVTQTLRRLRTMTDKK